MQKELDLFFMKEPTQKTKVFEILFLMFLLLSFGLNGFCQQSEKVKIGVLVNFANQPIVLHDSNYVLKDGSFVKFEILKFYLSNLQLLLNNKVIYAEPNSYHLIDCAVLSSQNIFLGLSQNIAFDAVKFNLGIDSLTNVSGAMGGNLDPVNGMYWTWQSGYINAKIEGSCLLSPEEKKEFEFHLGGYQNPFNPLQTIELNTTSSNFNIALSLDAFFANIDLAKQKNIMLPSIDAVTLSKRLSKCFSIQ
ncbi:MAG: MbnP family protein [bacterium]|nr:MbnP family protein [bacterium]